ncbi:aminoglycoside phosphotransferase family protein [Nocardia takedensis]|uniref:aminoglycoside phosphotransferase family protein n=1 Tax=Nocardia takedensis TaxID=259390 RepID=UPI0002F380A9|nr:aminoglycoside phosphotransferase family protein [Nocardia takedensis]
MIVVPEFFAERLSRSEGDPARAWLARLPDLVTEYTRRWAVRLDTVTPWHGYAGIALPGVRADGTPVVLKLGYVGPETRDEPRALAAWQGNGAVLLHDSDIAEGAMLLERLDERRSLEGEPIAAAVPIIATLLRRLAVPAPDGLTRDLRVEAERWATELPRDWERLGRPLPRRLLDAAVRVCRDHGPSAGDLLVNEDLHFENVLAGAREPWLVIDPQPLRGDVEFTTLSILWNRRDESTLDHRFAELVAVAGLDPERARAWTLVRAVQNWLWFVADGITDDFGRPAVQAIAPWAAR